MADFPLLNEASLVMIPGATKEGKVYSQVPTDGSGDFTFTRSTSATRVNEAGNIEKGYENLLLQSNTFDTTPWLLNTTSATSGQSGYDGSSDAWLLNSTGTGFPRVQQDVATSGVFVFSVYAKAATDGFMLIRTFGADSQVWFDLSDGSIVNEVGAQYISSSTEDVGNGWYRYSVLANGSLTSIRIYPASAYGVYSTSGNGIYIQDAQINQGLVATDYIETTTVPVYAGLTDNMPRLDYTDATCPSLLLEPSRTNLLAYSEYFEGWHTDANVSYTANSAISPEGLINAAKLTATNTSNVYVRDNRSSTAGNNVFSVFAKYEDCQYICLSTRFFNGGDEARVWFDIQNGVKGSSTGDDVTYDIEDYGNGWYRCYVIFNIDAGDTNGYSYIYLSNTDGSTNVTSGTSAHLYGGQFEVGSYPTSYIPTYGSTQTRAADVSSVTKAVSSEGSLFINVGGTSQPKLSVLGEYFDASTTENKVAIAYSSTALVISHNGSIVVNKTGIYDVSSLTQIQLGHSNGADQADSPISEFVTFDSFLTNSELNALTQ